MTSERTAPPLTAEQKRKYLRGRFGHCPYCDSEDIEGDSVDIDGSSAFQAVKCLACRNSWQDVYVLTDLLELPQT